MPKLLESIPDAVEGPLPNAAGIGVIGGLASFLGENMLQRRLTPIARGTREPTPHSLLFSDSLSEVNQTKLSHTKTKRAYKTEGQKSSASRTKCEMKKYK